MSSPNYNVFAHLQAPNAPLYRGILGVFDEAKARFIIHLRPADIDRRLAELGLFPSDGSPVESALQQLVDWGNLESHPDTGDVLTVEDFWRVRSLYQMSPAGDAAEQAISLFEQSIQQPGELQAAALDDIRRLLHQIAAFLQTNAGDADVFNTFSLLRQRFEELTAQAQRFISGLQRRVDLQALGVDQFVSYKERLIDYLDRFLNQLVLATHEIAALIRSIDQQPILMLLERVADRELKDRLSVDDSDRATMRATWEQRWRGFCSWFIGDGVRASQAEELRSAARAAIPSLIAAVSGINDRRAGRSDRTADLRALALWFAQTSSEDDAHRLWHAAFALHSCRHLSIDDDTLARRDAEPVASTESWLDAPPVRISPRLHASGRYSSRGRPQTVIDRTQARHELARFAAEESRQILEARRFLVTGKRVRLSELPELPVEAFHLFLELLGVALSAKSSDSEPICALSTDGTLEIELEPTLDGQIATIKTSDGVLIGDDHYMTIRSTLEIEPSVADDIGAALA
jgi:uncharacterized protein (TIGR02677 family)